MSEAHADYRCGAPACGACAAFPDGETPDMALQPVPRPDEEPIAPKGAADKLPLPAWVDEARDWLVATQRLAKKLADEDAQATGELRQIRNLRKLTDAVLDRIEPSTGAHS